MNNKILNDLKNDILERYIGRDGFLTDDLCERYDFEYENGEELLALWVADLLSMEIIASELKIKFDFDKAFNYGMEYLKSIINNDKSLLSILIGE